MRSEVSHVNMMRRVGLACFLAVTLLTLPVAAQDDQPDPPELVGWEMGFVYDEDIGEVPFSLDENGAANVEYWVRNDNIAGDITVNIECELSNNDPVECDESVTVGSGQNKTFDAPVRDVRVLNYSAGTIHQLEIRGELASIGSSPAVPPSIQNIEAEIEIPAVYAWSASIAGPQHIVSAGTSFDVAISLQNIGNTNDSLSALEFEDDCPLLTHDEDAAEDAVGPNHGSGAEVSLSISFEASASHPTRACSIELTVRSQGVADGGLGAIKAEAEALDIEIEAKPIGAPDDDGSLDDDEGPQNREEVVSRSALPLHAALAPLAIVLAASRRRNP